MSGIMHMLVAAKTAVVSAITDAFFNRVTLLLNTSSTNGAQNNTFIDSSSNGYSITRNPATGPNAPTQGTFTPFSQTGWGVFAPGTTGNYYSGTTNLWATNTSTFTVDGWINPTSYAASHGVIIGDNTPTGATLYIAVMLDATGKIRLEWYDGASKVCTGSTTVPLNSWSYFAVRVSSNAISIYVNSSSADTLTGTTTLTNRTATTNFSIAQYNNSSANSYAGYISNLRFSTIARTISVPTAAFASDADTKLLTFQSNRVVDNSPSPLTINQTGTPSVQAFSPFAPTAAYSTTTVGGSGYFDGTGDYLTLPDNSIPLSNSDFTIEGWVYPLNSSQACVFGGQGDAATAAGSSFISYINGAATTDVYIGSTSKAITSPTAPAFQWNHIAYVRTGGTFSSFVNGVRVGTNATLGTSSVNAGATTVKGSIGAIGNGTSRLTGYVSGYRVIIGSGGYNATSSTITIPTAPPTAVTNTQFLTNFTNSGIFDAAAKNDLETVGNAQVSTTQAKFGTTSMAFDGTGDWLLMPDSPNLQLGSGDFTIEGFVYLNAAGVAYGIISKGAASTGWSVNVTSGNKLQFSYTATALTGATSLAATTWYYFAVVRSGSATGNLKVYLDGSVDATSAGAVTDNFNQTNAMYVGASRTGTTALNGYLDEIRITKGVARDVTTVPTAAFFAQ